MYVFICRSPQESYITLKEHPPLLVNEKQSEIELVQHCPVAKGTALWVECSMPECGMKTVSFHLGRDKRSYSFPHGQYWKDPHPGEEEPHFRSVNEAHDFVKDFFNSISIFDKKKYYKRFWGPLVQPYLGVKDKSYKKKGGEDIPKTDPTQDSWKYYQHQDTLNDFMYYSQNGRGDDKASPNFESFQLPPAYYGSLPNLDTQGLNPQYANEAYNDIDIEHSPVDMNGPHYLNNYFSQLYYPQNHENNYPYGTPDDIPEYQHIDHEYQPSDYYRNHQFSPFLFGYEEGKICYLFITVLFIFT